MSTSTIPVSEIRKTRGFHLVRTTKSLADAILRGDKTAAVANAVINIQKGDWIAFEVYESNLWSCFCFHDLGDCVFEVTHVGDIPNCDPHSSLVCFKILPGYTFHPGDVNSKYPEDTITFDKPKAR